MACARRDDKGKEEKKHDRTAAALHAMEAERLKHHQVVGAAKVRPAASSSSVALAAKEVQELENLRQAQLAAYNEAPVEQKENKQAKSNKISHEHPHKIDAPHEMMPYCVEDDALSLVFKLLDGDVNTTWPGAKDTPPYTPEQRQVKTFFGRTARDIQDSLRTKATRIATLVLRGGEKEIEEAVALVKETPHALRCQVEAKDHLGRTVIGTPLQIAVMAGDVDLQKEIKEEKVRGAVERLLLAAGDSLSKEEIADQLTIIAGEEAQQKNAQRNQRVLTAVKRFGEGVCAMKAEKDMDFAAFQTHCNPLIEQLEKELQSEIKEVITSGYIFDPQILVEAAKWFEEEKTLKSFGFWGSLQSDVFWVNGWGKLQKNLSARDGHVAKHGIGKVVDSLEFPPRTLNNANGTSYFSELSDLGRSFYLGYYGGRAYCAGGVHAEVCLQWKTYVDQKLQCCKTYATSRQPIEEKDVMRNTVNRF